MNENALGGGGGGRTSMKVESEPLEFIIYLWISDMRVNFYSKGMNDCAY